MPTALLLAACLAPAQVPTAPPPHPVLADVLAEYRRLGLTLPPPDAELIRVKWFFDSEGSDHVLGFRMPARTPGGKPTYLLGSGSWYTDGDFNSVEDHEHKTVEPTSAALREVNKGGDDLLVLAVQCESRGWHAFAREVYALAREDIKEPVFAELRWLCWSIWESRLTRRGTDRTEVLRRLRALAAEDETFRTAENEALFRDLERTLASRKSKPGTVECLIDDLTEAAEDPNGLSFGHDRHPAFRKLAALGFDAVPALIEHIDDRRFTRARASGFNNFHGYDVRVGHLASWLLDDLAGGQQLDVWLLRGDRAEREKVLKWWAEARKVGEEKWLLNRALAVTRPENESHFAATNPVVFMALEAKYPGRLPELYRTILKDKPWVVSARYAVGVERSKLPRAQKIAILVEGANHARAEHRMWALEPLARLDPAASLGHLIPLLRTLPDEPQAYPQPELVRAVELVNTTECWDELAAAAGRLSTGPRGSILWWVAKPEATLPDPHRRERVRFLLRFLGDHDEDVRDTATRQLAAVLGRPLGRRVESRGALTRFLVRGIVGRAAELELARQKK